MAALRRLRRAVQLGCQETVLVLRTSDLRRTETIGLPVSMTTAASAQSAKQESDTFFCRATSSTADTLGVFC